MHYALLDIPQLGKRLTTAQTLNPNHVSLYRGAEDPQLADMAPLLFWYEPNDAFAGWLNLHWGNAFGISLTTDAVPDDVRKHFRRFLRIKTDDGQQLYFRYYDPRILSIFLPTCDASQVREFFGPIEQFIVEDPTRQRTLLFTQQNGSLQVTAQPTVVTY